jgi:carbonic anhydrase/acetyltransferase-like protein (isoleucine patch superfamily)
VKAAIVATGTRIAPFERSVDKCALGAGTFGDARAHALAGIGVNAAETRAPEDVVEGPALLIADDTWVTRRALTGFVKAVRHERDPVRLCLPRSRMLELVLPLQDVPLDSSPSNGANGDANAWKRAAFDVVYVPDGLTLSGAQAFQLGPERWRAPAYKEVVLDVPIPRHILASPAATMAWPLTSTIAMRVRHWVHVLRAGHLAPQVALLDHATARPISSAVRLALSWRPSKAARAYQYRRRFVFRGRNVFIHPTATVEASVIEDDVSIGAYAYVVNSVVGKGSVIEQRAHVSGSTLGPRTFVSLNSSLQACVTFGDTDACINGVQACVFAERCAMTSFAHPLDLAIGGNVKVDDNGTLRDAGSLPCGVAFGEGVLVGANVTISAGRAIPAGVRLIDDPARILRTIDVSAPGLHAVVDGALKRL